MSQILYGTTVYLKNYSLFIWNLHLTGNPVLCFVFLNLATLQWVLPDKYIMSSLSRQTPDSSHLLYFFFFPHNIQFLLTKYIIYLNITYTVCLPPLENHLHVSSSEIKIELVLKEFYFSAYFFSTVLKNWKFFMQTLGETRHFSLSLLIFLYI